MTTIWLPPSSQLLPLQFPPANYITAFSLCWVLLGLSLKEKGIKWNDVSLPITHSRRKELCWFSFSSISTYPIYPNSSQSYHFIPKQQIGKRNRARKQAGFLEWLLSPQSHRCRVGRDEFSHLGDKDITQIKRLSIFCFSCCCSTSSRQASLGFSWLCTLPAYTIIIWTQPFIPSKADSGHDWGKKLGLCRGTALSMGRHGFHPRPLVPLLRVSHLPVCHPKGLTRRGMQGGDISLILLEFFSKLRWGIESTHLLLLLPKLTKTIIKGFFF